RDQVITEVKVLRGRSEKVPVVARDDAVACVERGQEGKVEVETRLGDRVVAPVAKGQKLGEIVARADGKELLAVDLVAKEGVERGNIFQILFRMIRDLFRAIFGKG
ncbi:MAG TPA: hypothetical protein GX506_08930, partial [Firmicutes bacterium]|nr:hypothetical protein [Bacillota bacterium]